jgi:hypothetical protein
MSRVEVSVNWEGGLIPGNGCQNGFSLVAGLETGWPILGLEGGVAKG